MANKNIIVTQNDYGILITCSLFDEEGRKVNLQNRTVKLKFIYEDGTSSDGFGIKIDELNGITGFVLSQKETGVSGLSKVYLTVVDSSNKITAQEEIYYFVREEFGGEA